jgi:hypothetical protein
VAWKKTGNPGVHAGPFAAGTSYTVVVMLNAAVGYTLTGVTGDVFKHEGASLVSCKADTRTVTIEFAAMAKRPITGAFDLAPFLTAPAIGTMPATAPLYLPLAPFIGRVTWNTASPFVMDTDYTAVLSLEVRAGYTFQGVPEFTYTGLSPTISGNTGNSCKVTINFVKTAVAAAALKKVSEKALYRNLVKYVPRPVTGSMPVLNFSTAQYTATVSWAQASGSPGTYTPNIPFLPDLTYMATLQLATLSGYGPTLTMQFKSLVSVWDPCHIFAAFLPPLRDHFPGIWFPISPKVRILPLPPQLTCSPLPIVQFVVKFL